MIAMEPDYLFTISTDPEATKSAYRRAVDAGIMLVILDVAYPDINYPDEMVGVTACDPLGLGVAAGDIMAKALNFKGKVITLDWGIPFFVTNKREEGFRRNILTYPDMEVVGRETFPDPPKVLDAAEAMLPLHPDIDGMFATWAGPALDAMTAAKTLGRTDLLVTTCDLSERAAIEMARGEGPILVGLSAQHPYLQGVVETHQMVLHALNKTVPPYATVPPVYVTKDNLIDAWKEIEGPLDPEPPEEVVRLLQE